MTKMLILCLALVLPASLSVQTSPPTEDGALSQLVDTVLHQVATLHPGMPRSALATLFTEDGGLSSLSEERYVYRRCPSIKITVKFKVDAHALKDGTQLEPRDDDVIVEISKPYLELPFQD